MNLKRERETLKALLDIENEPALVVKARRRRSFGYFAGGIALLSGLAIWNKYLNDAAYVILSFWGGALLAIGYCRFAESARIRFLAPYLRRDELEARHDAVLRETGEPGSSTSRVRIVISVLFGAILVLAFLFFTDRFGNT